MPRPEALARAAEVERILHAEGFSHLRVRLHVPHSIICTRMRMAPGTARASPSCKAATINSLWPIIGAGGNRCLSKEHGTKS